MVPWLLATLVLLSSVLAPDGGDQALPPPPCHFQFGFADLRARLTGTVGDCLDDEHVDGASGLTVQHTTGGLLVWNPDEGQVAFTDGGHSWLLSPYGMFDRPNERRFPWEANPGRLPVLHQRVGDGEPARSAPGALLPGRRIVAFYGNPRVPAMGALGQGTAGQMLTRLQSQADAYAAADPATPVIQGFELISVVAEAAPGADGLYRTREPASRIEQVAGWAASRRGLLILDVQPGRSPPLSEVQQLLPYLQRPDVGLAVDPEFAMDPGQVPGTVYGHLDASTVNAIIDLLGGIVSSRHVPPKVLIIHRFREDMLTDYRDIHIDPRVQVVIDMDGFGSPGQKRSSYNAFVRDQPVEFAGIKPFYVQDTPPLTPAEILALQPRPSVVIYQ